MKKRYLILGLFGLFIFMFAINEDETKEMESTEPAAIVEEVEVTESEPIEVTDEVEEVETVDEEPTEEVVEPFVLPIEEVMSILQSSFGEGTEITYDEESSIISINSTDPVLKDELLLLLAGQLDIEVWNVMVDSFKYMSESLGEYYSVAFLNPHNTDNILLLVNDGNVLYNAFEE